MGWVLKACEEGVQLLRQLTARVHSRVVLPPEIGNPLDALPRLPWVVVREMILYFGCCLVLTFLIFLLKSIICNYGNAVTWPKKPHLLQLIFLQKASGSWLLDPALAAALGKTREEVEKSKPAQVSEEVWATILALICLHGFKMDSKEEWELLAMKAVSWLRAQNASCVTDCVEAANTLLGCSVEKDALRL
ncbi:von Willebrand factor A domain-containing protein 5A-like [Mugil cephalus]|uniref:von Willebrand factor A domain-containing protein 5A-like n=1 Tax=Mugil cephalus TaxID=48193 RepID=UPI001FB85503|nr:von Willebrand factor A domain-containing protein 5A-like [Mugil cephalus]